MTFLARLFGRKPKPPIDRRGWSEDWQVGDVAVCVIDAWTVDWPENPKRGDTLRVSGLIEGIAITGEAIFSALKFEGKTASRSWPNECFQKIRPAEQCFTEAMRNLLRQPVTPTGLSSADSDGGREGWDAPDHPGVNAGRSNGGHHIPANPINVAIFPVHHGE